MAYCVFYGWLVDVVMVVGGSFFLIAFIGIIFFVIQ
jgi:hypothetical protein